MAYAQELKNLVAEIKTGHQDRTQGIKDAKDTTHELIARFHGELKEMTRNLKNFLAKSEDTRRKDFDVMIKAIQARVKDIKGDTADLLAQYDKEMKKLAADLKDFLGKSEATRIADFKGMMKDINANIDTIRKAVRTTLVDYKTERKEAAGYWAKLRAKETAPAAPKAAAPKKIGAKETAPAAPKAAAPKKKGKKEK